MLYLQEHFLITVETIYHIALLTLGCWANFQCLGISVSSHFCIGCPAVQDSCLSDISIWVSEKYFHLVSAFGQMNQKLGFYFIHFSQSYGNTGGR